MESTFVWAGVWTSIGFSLVLLTPVVVEFFKRNLPVFCGIIMILTTLYLLAPGSPEIRALWVPLSQLPAILVGQLYGVFSRFF